MKLISQIIVIYLFVVTIAVASDFKIIGAKNDYVKIKKISKKELQINSIFLESDSSMYRYKLQVTQVEPFVFLKYKDFENYKNELPTKIIINYLIDNKSKNEILKIKNKNTNQNGLQLITSENETKKDKNIKKKANSNAVQCSGITISGERCKRKTTSKDGKCWQHK